MENLEVYQQWAKDTLGAYFQWAKSSRNILIVLFLVTSAAIFYRIHLVGAQVAEIAQQCQGESANTPP